MPRPDIKSVEETEYGKMLLNEPEKAERHRRIVDAIREMVRPEIEALELSEIVRPR